MVKIYVITPLQNTTSALLQFNFIGKDVFGEV